MEQEIFDIPAFIKDPRIKIIVRKMRDDEMPKNWNTYYNSEWWYIYKEDELVFTNS